jgi:hypothetical protein
MKNVKHFCTVILLLCNIVKYYFCSLAMMSTCTLDAGYLKVLNEDCKTFFLLQWSWYCVTLLPVLFSFISYNEDSHVFHGRVVALLECDMRRSKAVLGTGLLVLRLKKGTVNDRRSSQSRSNVLFGRIVCVIMYAVLMIGLNQTWIDSEWIINARRHVA